jgi:hypothetical protein
MQFLFSCLKWLSVEVKILSEYIMLTLLGRDIRRIENKNKLQLLYIDFFNLRDIPEIDYIRENREVIELMFKAMSVDSVHEYRMQTDAAYLLANLKIDISKCPECSADVIDYNWQQCVTNVV